MIQKLGEVLLDTNGALVCKTANADHRKRASAAIRKIAPSAMISVDGAYLRLDLATALALKEAYPCDHFTWSGDATNMLSTFSANYAHANRARRRLWDLMRPGKARKAIEDYELLSNLDEHQVIAVAAMTDVDIRGLCLFDEQGLGKTVMAIHAFDRLRQLNLAKSLLVFAPKNMVEEWKKDFQRFMGHRYSVQTLVGSKADKYDRIIEKADVYVTNYETAYSLESPLRSLLRRHMGRFVLVVDESFIIKNRDAKRSGAIRRLRYFCDRCWVLCGTPAPNDALDIVNQFNVADGGATFAGVELPKDKQQLRNVVKSTVEAKGVYLRRLKRDVLPDLPRKRFERVMVQMEEEQQGIYEQHLQSLIDEVKSIDDATFKKQYTSFVAKRMALLQICSHPGQVVDGYHTLPAKLDALDKLLHQLIREQGEKVVLWSFFRYSVNAMVERFKAFNPVRLDGSVQNSLERSKAIQRFQEDSSTMLFVGNPAAGGAGITLTRSRITVYESFSPQTAHYLQSLDRIHRRGQTRDAHYYVLLCRDTIEETEYERLLRKEVMAADLFGDPQPESTTREVFLGELMEALMKA